MPPSGVVNLWSPSSSEEAKAGVNNSVANRIDEIKELLNLFMESLLLAGMNRRVVLNKESNVFRTI